MRVQKLKLMGKYTQGVPAEQQYLLLHPSDDTIFKIQMAPLMRYHKEVWAAGDPKYATEDNLLVTELRRAFELAKEKAFESSNECAGPIGMAMAAADMVG